MENHIKCSLILCTLNRTYHVDAFLHSLTLQQYTSFECIVVDQNPDERLLPIIQKYSSLLTLIYVHSAVKGVSANRNLGIEYVTGELICFPDDDCEYTSQTLQQVVNYFESHPESSLYTCAVRDKETGARSSMPAIVCPLTRTNYFNKAISIGIFIRYININHIVFDTQLGVGATFGSAEESDLISTLIHRGYIGHYNGTQYVYHPTLSSDNPYQRYHNYNLGYGAFMKKEIFIRHNYYFVLPFLFDIIKRIAASLLPLRKRQLYFISLRSRINGFIKYAL